MRITAKQLAHAVYDAVNEHPEKEKEIVSGFIAYCEERNLVGLLEHVVRHLEILKEQHAAQQDLEITVAHQHDTDLVSVIKSFVKADESHDASIEVDPELQGGFIARFGDTIFNASVARQLEKAQHILTNR